jgi:hypothetical protein
MRRSGAASCNCVVTVYQPAAPDDLRNTTVAFVMQLADHAAPRTFLSSGSLPGGGFFALLSAAACTRANLRWPEGRRRQTGTAARLVPPAATATRCSPPDSVQACAARVRRASGDTETYSHQA